ncbi:SDR family oxidoreductase [Mesorhizobium sp.]|uniref:SDR family NAD(P)-dependent oxidoreductase n=1 Tax=Mesorhizobium sp. TaxID=1871066 RepID=UPI0025C07A96|nr:SDR family oxidoreductase [Mesorhizobium sp.]
MDRLKNKIALITGAGTGVGRACMKLFAGEGAKVSGVSRTQANLDETLSFVKANGGQGIVVAADLASAEGAEKAVADTLRTFGRIDVLVNCAGVGFSWLEKSPGSMGTVDETTPEKWREVMAINLDSMFHMCRLVIPHMKQQRSGSIVTVTSISGFQGLPLGHTYTAAKAGAINLTRSLAVTYCNHGIRANCIAPGYIDTPMTASVIAMFDNPDTADRLCPMKRAGTPEEMALACLYFASDESTYCQGSVLVVDGGTTARQ